MLLLFAFIGEINSIATVDIDGDGNYEAFLGTSKGLYLLKGEPSAPPKRVEGVSSPVLHISYYDDDHLLLTLDDIFTPITVMSYDGKEFRSLKVTGRYSKAYALNGTVYLLSESGLFYLKNDSLHLILDGARDATVCGVGGERRLFASSDALVVVVGPEGTDTIGVGSSYVICGDTAVYTEFGSILIGGDKPTPSFRDFAYEPHTRIDGLELKLRSGMLSVNGGIRGESKAVAFYPYNGRLYLLYGKYHLMASPLYLPYIRSTLPFVLEVGKRSVLVADLNLINSTSVGVLPVSPGEYRVSAGGKEITLQINHPGEYDLSSHLSGSPISVSYTSNGVEIYVELQRPSYVDVVIVSFTGKVVKHLFSGYRRGSFKLVWEGDLSGGKVARRGVYFVRVRINGRTYNRRFVWLR